MDRARIDHIAATLLEARRIPSRIDPPPGPTPADIAEAYSIQDVVTRALGPIGGWKVGASSPDAEPACAPLPAVLIHPSPARLPSGRHLMFALEAEIGFRVGRDLPAIGRLYERAEVEEAIAAVLPVIEVVESRWRTWPEVDRLWHFADHQANGCLVTGPERHDWRSLDLTQQPVRLTLDGAVLAETVGGNAAGDVIRPVVWLANHAAQRTGGLRAGDVVTTGSCTGVTYGKAGGHVIADLAGIGAAELSFA